MRKTAHIVMIHGIGNQKGSFWEKRIVELDEALEMEGIAAKFYKVIYAPAAQNNARQYWRKIDQDRDTDWNFARKPILHVFGDATVYGTRPKEQNSNYRTVHTEVHAALSQALAAIQSDDDLLVVRAHSFGCHVISNFVYDNQTGKHDWYGLKKLDGLEEKLRLFATTGCNIPLFVAGLPEPRMLFKPNAKFRWLNLYDKDDLLGWPLRPLGGDYAQDWVRDQKVNSGGVIRSHNDYWFTDVVNERIAEAIAEL